MKVLIVNAYRDRGSTGKIISELGNYLRDHGNEIIYVYRDGPNLIQNRINEKNIRIGRRLETALTYRINYIFGCPYSGAYLSTIRLIRIIKQEKPDVISMHSINGSYVNIPILVKWLKQRNIPTTITHHSEYLYTGNCTYAYDCMQWKDGCKKCKRLRECHISLFVDTSRRNYRLLKSAFEKADRFLSISVSPWVAKRAKESRIMEGMRQVTILNGINENVFFPHPDPDLSFRRKYAEDNKKVFLYSTAIFSDAPNDIKGGKYIIDLANRQEFKNCMFLVASLSTDVKVKLPPNIICLGAVVKQEDLAALYSCADALILTSKRETFSMPTAEALMCGTPVVGFEAGGPESIALSKYCRFVEYGNTAQLANALSDVAKMDFERCEIAKDAKSAYSAVTMCESYRLILEKLVKD